MTPILRTTLVALLTLFAAGGALAETLIGSGRIVTESRAVSGFEGVSVSIPGKVKVTQGDRESVTLTADDNVLPYVETFVDQNQLKIRFKAPNDGRYLNVGRVTISVDVTARKVESLAISGSGDVAAGPIRSKRLVANISGSGNMDIASVQAEDMNVTISGSGDLAIRGGRTETLNVRVSGSGDVNLSNLESLRAKVRVAGSGDARLWVRETLSARVAGSGDVKYYGDPKVERSVAGSGEVRRAGASPS